MARKESTTDAAPEAKTGRFAQIRQTYKAAVQVDPSIRWWMIGAFLVPVVVFELIGLIVHHWVYFLIISIPFGFLSAAVVMGRRTERAVYGQIEGQPGAAGAALSALRRGWYYDREPIAVEATRPGDFTSAAMVFRAIGRPGVVLVNEGPLNRATRLADNERKKIARVAPGVPVQVLRIGADGDAVPVRKLARTITRMKPQLTKAEVDAVNKRLKALGGVKMPVPKGMDPLRQRPDRKAMRGR